VRLDKSKCEATWDGLCVGVAALLILLKRWRFHFLAVGLWLHCQFLE